MAGIIYPLWLFIILVLILFVLVFWTIIGNSLVLISLLKFKQLKSNSNILIGNLALSDILLALTVMPMSVMNDILGYWMMGLVTCNFWLTLDVLYCTASIWSLVAIAFDRFTATSFPSWYREKVNSDRVALYIALVWVLSIGICLPPVIGWNGVTLKNPADIFRKNYQFNNLTKFNDCILFRERNYVIYSSMGSFIVPLLILLCFYAKIFFVIQNQARHVRKIHKTQSDNFYSSEKEENYKRNKLKSCDHHPKKEKRISINRPYISTENCPKDLSMPSYVFRCEDEKKFIAKCDRSESVYLSTYTASHEERSFSSNSLNTSQTNPVVLSQKSKEKGRDSFCIFCDNTTLAHIMDRFRLSTCKDISDDVNSVHSCVQNNRSSKFSIQTKIIKQNLIKVDRKEQRATKRMALIIVGFIFCWIPFTVMYLTRSLFPTITFDDHLVKFLIWLGYSNSAINPILYTIFNRDFRRSFQKILSF